jgi:hypothetical protein
MPDIELRSGDELIRFIFMPHHESAYTVRIARGQKTVEHGPNRFSIAAGVIDGLIRAGILGDEDGARRVRLDYDRGNAWLEQEEVRKQLAHGQLVEKYYTGRFTYQGYEIVRNSRSMDHDTRGFVFTDEFGDRFLVCEGGRVLALLRTAVAAA